MFHPSCNYGKNYTRLQNKYHPESSENQAVWKSDNQGFEVATIIQMDRRGGDIEKGGEVQRGADLQSGVERCRMGSPTFTYGR